MQEGATLSWIWPYPSGLPCMAMLLVYVIAIRAFPRLTMVYVEAAKGGFYMEKCKNSITSYAWSFL